MRIIDLTPEYEKLYFCCLEDWSDEIKEAGDHKECWYRKVKDKGLRVKLAQEDDGTIGGMIQYLPVGLSFVEGRDLYMIMCIWIHGHKAGRGNHQKKGLGKALLKAAEDDVRNLGGKGIAAWGIIFPFFMRASWFKKQGYSVTDKDGMMRLLWKPFTNDAIPPLFIKRKKKPVMKPGRINVSLFLNGWCPAQNMVYERTKRALSGFEHCTELNEYMTDDRNVFEEWGISDAVFIDKREIRNGPPASYQKIRKIIEKKAKGLA
jgi:GNAT superfamily N-acetyltransferase